MKGLCTRGGGKSILFGDFKFIHIAKHVWGVGCFYVSVGKKSQAEIGGLITGEGNSTLVGVVINLITDLIPKLCTSNIHITIQYTLNILEYT